MCFRDYVENDKRTFKSKFRYRIEPTFAAMFQSSIPGGSIIFLGVALPVMEKTLVKSLHSIKRLRKKGACTKTAMIRGRTAPCCAS